eukprot:gnl/TRDRNA2_/TRDRNA2_131802_c1_seq1.p1 gnl/TRDRNA2_/TRDRNA2_131802_c1~~gnl/TRDRNA2_/TRDRNA2_131802_c1_seq1.p1  ORF type:complete len:349 (-),score=37.16 gnl/TRDRNA2_/TRDRNA2_131802_c1_seq1:17-1063(-)
MGAKASHSCLPNCMWTTETGKLQYRVFRPISKGEQITINYIAGFYLPIEQRRSALLRTKLFVCCCARCSVADDCRTIRCHRDCSGSIRPLHGNDTQRPPRWLCSSCGEIPEADLKTRLEAEARFANQVGHYKKSLRLETKSLYEFDPDIFVQLARDVSDTLSPTHFLNVQVFDLLYDVCIKHAEEAHNRCGTPTQLFRQAASAAIRAASICECLSAGCDAGIGCTAQHAACPEMRGTVLRATEALMRMVRAHTEAPPLDLVKFVKKYMNFNNYMSDPDAVRTVQSLSADALNLSTRPNLSALEMAADWIESSILCLSTLFILVLVVIVIRSCRAFPASPRRSQDVLIR